MKYRFKLSRRRALKFTAAMWRWLAEHPGCGKSSWPGMEGLNAYDFDSECPCCEYAMRQTRSVSGHVICKFCPLRGFAWAKHCSDDTSPYTRWRQVRWAANPQASAKAAWEIELAACRALNPPKKRHHAS